MSDEHSAKAVESARPILVAVDFTADSEAALVWACRYSVCAKAPLKVMHVIHDPGDTPGHYRRGEEDVLRSMEEVAAEMMAEFLARVSKKNPDLAVLEHPDSILVKGIPPNRILEVAEREKAQLIVMGSRGRTGLPHLLLGSKAERVVQLSPVPVTIVKASAEDTP